MTKRDTRAQANRARHEAQELHSWVVVNPDPRSSSLDRTHEKSPSAPGAVAQCTVLPRRLISTIHPRSPYWSSSASWKLSCLPTLLLSQDFQCNVIQMLMAQYPLPGDHIRYFKILALTDAECLPLISSCYGRSACLDAAIDCIAARIWDFLSGTSERLSTLRMYVRALQKLQESIDTAAHRERFAIYYSIPLLMLFELLNPSDQIAYMNHSRGSTKLVSFIGPGELKTELDKTLFVAQSTMMVTERLRDGHAHLCAEPKWKHFLLQSVKNDRVPGTNRSEADVTLTMIAAALPDAFNRVEKIVLNPNTTADPSLRGELNEISAQFQCWQQRWESVLRAMVHDALLAAQRKFQLAVYFMYSAILKRLAAAAPASWRERLSSENAALAVANNALDISAMADVQGFACQTKIAAVTKLVQSVTLTSGSWRREIQTTSSDGPISQTLFRWWCGRIDRESAVLRQLSDLT